MTFSVTYEGRCAGGDHVHLMIHIGEQSRRVTLSQSDLFAETDEPRELIRHRLRSFVLEKWTGSWNALRDPLEAADFKVCV